MTCSMNLEVAQFQFTFRQSPIGFHLKRRCVMLHRSLPRPESVVPHHSLLRPESEPALTINTGFAASNRST